MSRRVAIVGYGVEGRSAYRYFAAQNAEVTVFDEKQPNDLPDDVVFHIGIPEQLDGFDLVMRSPSIRPDRLHTDGRVSSVTNEFLRVFGTERTIGVTGSKGKGTTCSLIYGMLQSAGLRVHVGGNIGVPALDLLDEARDGDYIVLELSSFQLWDLQASPHIAVLLMMEPEHLDVHTSVDEYIQAKAQIGAHQSAQDFMIYLPTNDLTKRAVSQSAAEKIPYTVSPGAYVQDGYIMISNQRVIAVDELGLIGQHNVDNACAAVTVAWQITQDIEALARALRDFKGLPHHLQRVREVNGVTYYDDSIATTPSSAIAAMRAIESPKVMLFGGSDKGADFAELAKEVAYQNVAHCLLVGDMQQKIYDALRSAGVAEDAVTLLGKPSMDEIVARTAQLARPGDAVLLSPACASFDMFRSYQDRAEQFVRAVEAL